ncbi:Glycosyltransferase [Flavobacterium sp. 9AF]|uniref:glycosyltransferase family 9 protein n=1 Tax=Flavobacterium sp. 9AF TaxID=2653142 RepID=UPI0012F0747C|nr:glycosyltransferase family 9 protein [Flavobacterium sp. 9AF]VXC12475.1 Glycosyltransferase [Flavobacterium sp. 9AF]
MRILVIQKKKIGDVLTSTVILEAIKKQYPEYKIDYLIYENAQPVVINNPYIDELIVLDEKTRKNTSLFFNFLKSIRQKKYDVVIDAYAKTNSILIAWFSGAKKTISYEKWYTKLFLTTTTHRNEIEGRTTALSDRLNLVEPLGIFNQDVTPKIFMTDVEIEKAKKKLIENNINLTQPIIMVSAIGSEPEKTLPLKYMAKTLDIIAHYNSEIQILLNYIPFQKSQVKEMYELCEASTKKQIFIDFFENDLRDFLAVTKLCKALIGNEGGATNMSKALGIPTFSIFSPDILKKKWFISEDGLKNVSIEIYDYLPNVDQNLTVFEKYEQFMPELYKPTLINFLNNNI